MATLPVTLLNGTTADADDVMDDFTEIYTNITNTNIAASAGIVFSKLDSATVAGVSATQTLTNKTLTSPTINAGALSGTFSGTPTFSGVITFGANILLSSGNSVGLDGTTNNAVRCSAANTLAVRTNNTDRMTIASDVVITANTNLFVDSTGLIGFDGTANNNIRRSAANTLAFTTNATQRMTIASDVAIAASTNLILQSGSNLLLDGSGGNDYWTNSANGVNSLFANGVEAIKTNTSGEVLLANVNPPTANYANRNGIVKGWVNYNRVTNTVNASYNVDSVTPGGAGVFTINWNTDFGSGNYVVICTSAPGVSIGPSAALAAGTTQITTQDSSTGVAGSQAFNLIMAIGTQ